MFPALSHSSTPLGSKGQSPYFLLSARPSSQASTLWHFHQQFVQHNPQHPRSLHLTARSCVNVFCQSWLLGLDCGWRKTHSNDSRFIPDFQLLPECPPTLPNFLSIHPTNNVFTGLSSNLQLLPILSADGLASGSLSTEENTHLLYPWEA